ncbi:MAG TPA: hypothetical protein VN577_20530 [Terriglobales bacterium]|nr:hypothetical protein [Terriglobales bacterium]
MSRVMRIAAVFVAVLAMTYIAVPANAQAVDNVKVHFDHPVAVPGQVLASGDYVFHVMDPWSAVNTVLIRSADNNRYIGYFHMVPTERSTDAKTEVVLNSPDAIGLRTVRDLFVAGNRQGLEFKYSRGDASKLDQMATNLGYGETVANGF